MFEYSLNQSVQRKLCFYIDVQEQIVKDPSSSLLYFRYLDKDGEYDTHHPCGHVDTQIIYMPTPARSI
jgi:hypothetical protein